VLKVITKVNNVQWQRICSLAAIEKNGGGKSEVGDSPDKVIGRVDDQMAII
jgi:hypothetical protein